MEGSMSGLMVPSMHPGLWCVCVWLEWMLECVEGAEKVRKNKNKNKNFGLIST